MKPFLSICFELILGFCPISGPECEARSVNGLHQRADSLLKMTRESTVLRERRNELTGEARWSEGVAMGGGSLSFSSLAVASTKNAGN